MLTAEGFGAVRKLIDMCTYTKHPKVSKNPDIAILMESIAILTKNGKK